MRAGAGARHAARAAAPAAGCRRGSSPETLEVSERTILATSRRFQRGGHSDLDDRGAGGGIDAGRFQTPPHRSHHRQRHSPVPGRSAPSGASPRTRRTPTRTNQQQAPAHAYAPAFAADTRSASRTWFLHDPDPWSGQHIPPRRAAPARTVRATNTERSTSRSPRSRPSPWTRSGLVLKAGSWHLVCSGPAAIEVVCIDELRATRLTAQQFTPPAAFDLAETWQRYVAAPAVPAEAVDRRAAARPGPAASAQWPQVHGRRRLQVRIARSRASPRR